MKNLAVFLLSLLFLSSIAVAAEFSADMITEMSMGRNSGKIFYKDSDTSRTEMMGMINIMKYPDVFQLVEETRKYVVSDFDEMSRENSSISTREFDRFLKENDFKKTGSEILQGYKCEIYEGRIDFSPEPGQEPVSVFTKLWYSPDLEFALRTESTLPSSMGKVVSFIENINKGRQPASLFEIPPGYTRVDTLQEAMGMETGSSMPEGFDGMTSEDMPSSEEMQEMIKKMQEMME